MRNVRDATGIRTGWDVYGSDGQHLGSVGEVGDNYLLVQKGMIFVHDIFVPVSAVDHVAEEAVYLNVPKADVDAMGWEMPPTEGSWTEWSQSGGTTEATQDRERIAVHEEELEARTTARQAGEVQVRKDVVEEQRTIDVPVTREEVQIKRVPVDRDASTAEPSFDEGETIRVPVMEEDVEVTRRPRVKEEIEIKKVAKQGKKRASGTVRKEQVDVSQEGDARIIGTSDRGAPTRKRRDTDDEESGTEALGAGAGALGGAAIGGAVGGPPGAVVGGALGAAAGGVAGEASEGDEEAGSGAGGAAGTVAGAAIGGAVAGPPGAVVGGAVGGGAGAGLGDKAEEETKDEDDSLAR